MARDYCIKMEERVGYESNETWKAKEKLIELLVKYGKDEKVEEALSVTRDYCFKMEAKLGFESFVTRKCQ